MKKVITLAAILVAFAPGARADEGMWIFNAFPREVVKKKHGFEPSDAWLDHVRLSSLRFGGGCSASFVSESGLIMTNHHCARGCIQELSSAKTDYTKNGFYAKTPAEEQRCPALEVRQLVGIDDVTGRVNGATKGLPDDKFADAQKAEMSRIEKECSTDANTVCEVVSLWHGGCYHLYRYRKHTDVRLVFAPEHDIAFFGGDPDNFNFPRYDLDVTFLRAYENGQPARSQHYFKWSPSGAREGDLTFIPGQPGSTKRLDTVAQLEHYRDLTLPAIIRRMAELRGSLTEFARRGPEQKRISAGMLFGIENSLKVLVGQHETLLDKRFMAQKVAAEEALRAKVKKSATLRKQYGGAWDAVAQAVAEGRKTHKPYTLIEYGQGFQCQLFGAARSLVRGVEEREKPNDQRLREYRDTALPSLTAKLLAPAPIYRELEELVLTFSLTKLREILGPDDPLVRKVLGEKSPEELARAITTASKLYDPAVRKKLWEGGKTAVDASDDPAIRLAREVDAEARALRRRYDESVEGPFKKNKELIARAMFDVHGTAVYPDATGTLRLTYGRVAGYDEPGRRVAPFTTFRGAFDRATGREPFALPKSWLDAKSKVNLETPLNFATTNDIIGGNSGSPVVNRDGEVVGIVFDGNIHSLAGAYLFDETLNRAVSVSSVGMLEALRNIYRADRVVQELVPSRRAAR